MSMRWAQALRDAGTPAHVVQRWEQLRVAVSKHQRLLADNGIGKEVDERERVRVNARRVGLEAPPFAEEVAHTFAGILQHAMRGRSDHVAAAVDAPPDDPAVAAGYVKQ